MTFKKAGIAGAVTALACAIHISQAAALDVKGNFKIGYDGGGDALVTVVFTDGTRENIKSNEGFYLGGGVSLITDDKSVETEISLSYKFEEITASNGDVTWSRLPLDVLAFYRWSKVRAGAGATYHINPELDGSGVASGLNGSFENSLGFVIQADWRITENMNLGARYTMLDYEVSGSNTKVDATGIGVVFSGNF
jgi:hypothetical protein